MEESIGRLGAATMAPPIQPLEQLGVGATGTAANILRTPQSAPPPREMGRSGSAGHIGAIRQRQAESAVNRPVQHGYAPAAVAAKANPLVPRLHSKPGLQPTPGSNALRVAGQLSVGATPAEQLSCSRSNTAARTRAITLRARSANLSVDTDSKP